MNKPKFSWQGIGISSNPFQNEDPSSLHLLAHLKESARTAEEHLIVIADDMQIPNYHALHGIKEKKAKKIARKKGKRKQRNLRRILRANGLNNVVVRRFSEVVGENESEIIQQVRRLYESDNEVRRLVQDVVPQRLREKAVGERIVDYVLTEVGLILSLPGEKFGHEREKSYDSVASFIHETHRIGKNPKFKYSKLGLEYVPDTGTEVEPYSSYDSKGRLLLTDNSKTFEGKLKGLSKKSKNKTRKGLERLFGISFEEGVENFYDKIIRPSYDAFRKPFRIARNSALAATASLVILAGVSTYISQDAQKIRQEVINEIPGFVFSGSIDRCIKVVDKKMSKAEEKVKGKYGFLTALDI